MSLSSSFVNMDNRCVILDKRFCKPGHQIYLPNINSVSLGTRYESMNSSDGNFARLDTSIVSLDTISESLDNKFVNLDKVFLITGSSFVDRTAGL